MSGNSKSSPIKQSDKPLFEDIIWSRPERSSQAGKLLIVGGNRESIKAPLLAYEQAIDSGAGDVKVVLPDAVSKLLGEAPNIIYCPSNNSGGFGEGSFEQIAGMSSNFDCLLVTGDTGANSQTLILVEELVSKLDLPIVIVGDTLNNLAKNINLLNRDNLCLVANPAQFQKIITSSKLTKPYHRDTPLNAYSKVLTDLQQSFKAKTITWHLNQLWVSSNGQVSQTKRTDLHDEITWTTATAARSAVFWLQHSDQPFQALTTAVFDASLLE